MADEKVELPERIWLERMTEDGKLHPFWYYSAEEIERNERLLQQPYSTVEYVHANRLREAQQQWQFEVDMAMKDRETIASLRSRITELERELAEANAEGGLRWETPSNRTKQNLEGEMMCCGCWHEEGAPIIDNECVRGVQSLIQEVYRHSAVGGNLHCVLDDNNLDDESLESAAKQIANGGWKDEQPDPPEQLAAERRCLDALQAMTYEERISA